ncbi:MAG: BAX inhibitor (BI)-1/YccA family protein [Paracoccus denitrificans]|nr:MAG: BAX inhibitor (BI)-1/YccA family protein [Paracoccus denitrificans]PZO82963.1 MAG: BAX inhibitor (BI)-1/YccA family protein [Paracoccus denitrificans]
MADYNAFPRTGAANTRTAQYDEGLRTYMNKVYGLMSVGMVLTAITAWGLNQLAVGSDGNATQFGMMLYHSPLKWVVMFLPLVMVFAFGAAISRLSVGAATILFYAFAVAMGASISWIFLAYAQMSIATTFLATAGGFAALSLYGYTTKRDLSGMGRFLMIGLIGLIIAMLVNLFVQSSAVQFAVSAIGVLIFAGLTAYDTQNIKNTYLQMRDSGDDFLGKSAIMGALTLYLDFLNLFMFLLQFMGNRNN